MPITASKYINNSKDNTSYIGLYHYTCPARGKDTCQLDMYGLMCISSKTKIPGDKIAKFAWDGIVDGFEYSKTNSTNESLKLSLTEATRRIKQLISNDKEIGEYGVNVDFSVVVANGTGTYIGLLGESDIFVYKENRIVNISEMLVKKRAKTAGVLLGDGDIIFLSTKDFLKNNLTKIAISKSSDQLITALGDLGKDVAENQALVVFLHQQDELKKGLVIPKLDKKKDILPTQKTLTEPSDSDYIPTTKESKKILKSPSEGKDLKHFLSSIFLKTKSFFKTIGLKLSPVKGFLKEKFRKVGLFFTKTYSKGKGSVSKKLGKEKWFKRASAKISQSSLGRKRQKGFKPIKVDGYKEKDKRMHRVKILLVSVVGIVLLLSGIRFTLNQKEARERSKQANEIFTQVEELVSQAQETLTRDRDSTQMLMFKATEQLSDLPEELSEKDAEKYQELEGLVLGISDTLFKRTRLSQPEGSIQSYFETLVQFGKDSKPSDIGIYRDENANEYLLVVDSGTKAVFRIALYDKKHVAIPDENNVLKDPRMVYSKDSGVYVMDFSSGVVKAEFEGNWFKPFTTLSGLSISNISADDIAEFAVLTTNENVYVLDRDQKSLLRSTRFGTGYGLASQYLTKDDYANANDVLADLSVFILTPGDNGVHRYVYSPTQNRMVESSIKIVGLDKPLGNARYGFTMDDLNKSFYIFDTEYKRILRFEKPLESGDLRHPNELHLLRQYVFEQEDGAWDNVKDFVVDFKEEYLYLLDGTTIWKVRL